MRPLYLASLSPRSGKTVYAAALARRAAEAGHAVSYLKPLRLLDKDQAADEDLDALFLKEVLGLSETVDTLNPSALAPSTLEGAVSTAADQTREAFDRVAQGKDIVFVEGLSGAAGSPAMRINVGTASAIAARVLLIVWYEEEMDVGRVAAAAREFGDRLAGLVINAVPRYRLHYARTVLGPRLEATGVSSLTIVPQIRLLLAPTLRQIADHLGGEVLAYPERLDHLVECVMIGALALDGGIYYFGQRERKVVMTRWDRPDLQMPAMETGCQGFILTGGQGPIPYIWNRVQELQIPVIVVQSGTIAAATKLNHSFFGQRGLTHHPERVEALIPFLEGPLDPLHAPSEESV